MRLEPEVSDAPEATRGWVEVMTRERRHFEGRLPTAKVQWFAQFGDVATPDEIRDRDSRAWALHDQPDLRGFWAERGEEA